MELISIYKARPVCEHEDTETGENISDSLFLHGVSIGGGMGYGIGHYKTNGDWVCYEAEHDFMNIEKVTHWAPLPKPKEGA